MPEPMEFEERGHAKTTSATIPFHSRPSGTRAIGLATTRSRSLGSPAPGAFDVASAGLSTLEAADLPQSLHRDWVAEVETEDRFERRTGLLG